MQLSFQMRPGGFSDSSYFFFWPSILILTNRAYNFSYPENNHMQRVLPKIKNLFHSKSVQRQFLPKKLKQTCQMFCWFSKHIYQRTVISMSFTGKENSLSPSPLILGLGYNNAVANGLGYNDRVSSGLTLQWKMGLFYDIFSHWRQN